MPGNCCKQEKDRCKQKKQQLQAENDNDTTVETLKQKTARGLFWGGMNTMVQQVIGLLFGIILGRLLAPSDYGMMAIISVFSLVAVALQDSGFKVALANEKAPTPPCYPPPTSTRPRLARRHQGLLLPLHLRMALLAV